MPTMKFSNLNLFTVAYIPQTWLYLPTMDRLMVFYPTSGEDYHEWDGTLVAEWYMYQLETGLWYCKRCINNLPDNVSPKFFDIFKLWREQVNPNWKENCRGGY